MRKFAILCLLLASTFILMAHPSSSRSQEDQGHVKWVESSLKDMETIKVGMTRADLLKVFMEEGGLSTRRQWQYAYRHCPYFKIKVEFMPVGDGQSFGESAEDAIVKLSRPFLQRIVID